MKNCFYNLGIDYKSVLISILLLTLRPLPLFENQHPIALKPISFLPVWAYNEWHILESCGKD